MNSPTCLKSTTHSNTDHVLRGLEHRLRFVSQARVLAVWSSDQLQFKLYQSKREQHGNTKKTCVTYSEENSEENRQKKNLHPNET